jgi:SAM-dependent methyltransferase
VTTHYADRDRAVWQGIFASMPDAWFAAPPSDAMLQCRSYFTANPCERLLDVGCGFGRWALFLAGETGGAIVGVDYAELGIKAASAWAARTHADAKFLVATAVALPFRRATFDGVLAALLLDNLSRPDLGRALREINGSARAGARGFFAFSPVLSEAESVAASRGNPTCGCMHVAYDDDELRESLSGWEVTRMGVSAEGFRLVEAIYGDGEPQALAP